ncbi:phosphoinositide 3-kinase regulatory subunit 6 isoform 1-T2 [Pholidichthys leucotaenia]
MALWCNPGSGDNKKLAAGGSPTVPEADLYRSVQSVLPREDDNQKPSDFSKGMLRWTLHKKVQKNPVNSLSLVWVLLKELEKAERLDCRKTIIPLLHMLMYAILQTAYIPDQLYKRVYDLCKKLLTFPHPYCTVGLSYTRQIKTERFIPGLMYQRMVTTEQRLKNVHYPFQERVFVLAEPDIFHGSLLQVVSNDVEASTSSSGGLLNVMCGVVQHSIQAALGEQQCHGPRLAQALKDMGHNIETYFQDVLATLEQSVEEGCKGEGAALRTRLLQLYSDIVADTGSGLSSSGALCDCPLPNPEMSFHLWTEDFDIWHELGQWFRSSSGSDQFCLSQEQEDIELGESPSDQISCNATRFSILSIDSGIVRDIDPSPPSNLDSASLEQCKGEQDPARLSRHGGIKMKPTVSDGMMLMQDTLEDYASVRGAVASGGTGGWRETTRQRRAGSGTMQIPSTKPQRQFTARIVAMGDDRVLGRLAKAYYAFR